ncbi:MAG: gliding motility-associated C-terminal domain-containing protein [Bacteroidales bacterium]|nr:gliding motility-associated C-terminal domain-containing protein [Bacteroidales bacterium]
MTKKKHFFFFLLAGFLFFTKGYSQTSVAGIVNQYARVVSIDGFDRITLADASAFSDGDTVLLIQMKGVGIDVAGTHFGDPQNPNNAGKYEFLIIQTVAGNQVIFTVDLTNTYDNDGDIQLIKVPGYTNVTVSGTLTCPPWDSLSGTGGVLAVIVGNTLTMQADIDVSAKGFRGGVPVDGNGECTNVDAGYDALYFSATSDSAGAKGEGIASYSFLSGGPLYPLYARGRGPLFNGGGGGNGRYSGGGGGANMGAGGWGGLETSSCGTLQDRYGLGGKDVSGGISTWKQDKRIFMGGGGGSGTRSGGLTATPGGRGGGIVIILAHALVANGHTIDASGESVMAIADAAGGGGGAGGSVLLDVNEYKDNLTVRAVGGQGGSTNGVDCPGAGGGGGGGLIWYRNSATAGNLTPDVTEGVKGDIIGICANAANDGVAGIVANDLNLVLSGFLFNSIYSFRNGELYDTLCEGETVPEILGSVPKGGIGPYDYKWIRSDNRIVWDTIAGETGSSMNLNIILYDTVYYKRVVSDNSPTKIVDVSKAVAVIVQPEIQQNIFGFDTVICAGQIPNVIVPVFPSPTGGDGTYTYFWEESTDGVTFTAATGMNTGSIYLPPVLSDTVYYRRTVYSGKCSDISDTIAINVLPVIADNAIGATQTICQGATFAQLTGTNPTGGDNNYTFQWIETPDHSVWDTAYGINNASVYQPDTTSPLFPGQVFYRRVVFSGLRQTCADTSNEVSLREWPGIVNNRISADRHICEGETPAPLTGTVPGGGDGSYTYLWEESPDSLSYTPGTETNTGVGYSPGPLSDTVYYRRIVFSDVCRDTSEQVKILVDPAIVHYGIQTLSGGQDTTVCAGQPLNRLVPETTPVTGGNGTYDYLWNISEDGGSTWSNSGGNTPDYDPGTFNTTTLVRRQVTSGVCQVISDTVAFNILPVITQNTLPADYSICMEDSTLITGSVPAGGDGVFVYTWQESDDNVSWNGVSGNGTGQNYQTPGLTAEKYFRRIVFSGLANTCRDTTPPVRISIYPLPSAAILPLDTAICDGAGVDLVFQVNGVNGPWTIEYDDGNGNGASAGINSTTPENVHITPGSSSASTQYTYTLSALTDQVGCKARPTDLTGSANVRVDGQPQVDAGGNDEVCGLSYTLQAVTPPYGTWWWTAPAGVILSDTLEIHAVATADTEGIYDLTLHVSNGVCPVRTDVSSVTFWQEPGDIFTGADTILEPGVNEVTLTATWQDPKVGELTWAIESGAVIDDVNSLIIHASDLDMGENLFHVSVVNGACPAKVSSVRVTVLDFKAENYAISPNQDNINDYLIITGADNIENRLIIFDHRGNTVFRTDNFMHADNPGTVYGWNGVNDNNEPLPDGTYFYILELKGKIQKNIKGYIIIKRHK